MKCDAKYRKWDGLGQLGSLKVIGNVAIRQSAHDFLFDFNRNCASVLYRSLDITSYLSKVVDFTPPHLHLATSQGVFPVAFCGDLWQHKTRIPGLWCGVISVI